MNEKTITSKYLERAAVPLHFPQFKNAASLAHLAHCSKGPPYILVGGRAWYDVEEIRLWLDDNKKRGPGHPDNAEKDDLIKPSQVRKRGRPTKMEQYQRRVRETLNKAVG